MDIDRVDECTYEWEGYIYLGRIHMIGRYIYEVSMWRL